MRPSSRLLFLSLAVTAAIAPAAFSQGIVSPSISNLAANTNNQQLQLFVSGTDLVAGLDLYLQLNTNQNLPSPVFTGVPSFSSIDILTGTIFVPSNTGQNNLDGPDDGNNGIINAGTISGHLALVSTTTVDPQTVTANGLLANLTINTTGINSGVFQLRMLGTLNDDSFLTLPNGDKLFPQHINNNTNNALAFLISVGDPTRQWSFNGSGDWSLNSNWNPFASYAAGDQSNFLGAVSAGTATVSLNGNRTTGNITFNNTSASYTIAQGTGAGVLTLNNNGAAAISNLGGNHTIAAPLSLTANTTINVANSNNTLTFTRAISGTAHALSLTGNGKMVLNSATASKVANVSLASIPNGSGVTYTPTLDLSTSVLIVQTTGAADKTAKISALNALITSGSGTGSSWTGTGITSSSAQGANSANYAVGIFDNGLLLKTSYSGQATDTGSLFVAVARIGDSNRDGIVDINDLGNLANKWQQAADTWDEGDFNRSGFVDINDLGMLASNWQQSSLFSVAMASFPQLNGVVVVPEPASLAMLALGGAALLIRRRNRH